MDNLDLKIFVTSVLLLELLDETQGESKFKHKLKFHINGTIKQLEPLLSVPIEDENLSMLITDAVGALELMITKKVS
jgi:hypothetical protein